MNCLRILLVDDSLADTELAKEVFGEHQNVCSLLTYTNAQDALTALKDSALQLPDVLILDVNMPAMSGLRLLEVLKSDPQLRYLPVVMLSDSAEPADVQQAYALCASSYLVKPTNFPDYVEQVKDFVHYWRRCTLPQAATNTAT